MIAAFPLITAAIMASAKHMKSGRVTRKANAPETKGGGTAPSHPFELIISNHPLRRVLITGAVILTGIDLFHFYMPIYGHHIGLSASQIGMVLAVFSAASFVVRVWMPAIVKRLGAERVLILSMFVAATTYLAVPYITHVIVLCVVCFVLGLGTGCGQPLSLSMIYERAPGGRSGEALGLRATLNNFTHMVTPLLFGAIGTAFGVAPVFWCNSLMLAGGGIIIRRK
jgi:MFS family permease